MKCLRTLCLVLSLGLGFVVRGQIYSSNIVGYVNLPILAGDNLIANQLSYSDNTLSSIFGVGVPDGSTFTEWNPAAQQFLPVSTYSSETGWSINYSLTYGEGGLFHSTADFTNTFVGDVWPGIGPMGLFNPPLISADGLLLLSCVIPITNATFYAVVGRNPQDGEYVTRLDPTTQTYFTTTYHDGAWDNGDPVLGLGESAFFNLGPVLVPEPAAAVLAAAGFLGATTIRRIFRRRRRRGV